MSDIEKVKKLREATGAGFKDCNLAIKESGGDLDKAVEILRVKGISKASKKMSRDAKEGLVAITPSLASLDIFLEAFDMPLTLKISTALSKSPPDSLIARLQSLKPAPVASRNCLTFSISLISLIFFYPF